METVTYTSVDDGQKRVPRRRRICSLRLLFGVVTVIALVLGIVAWIVHSRNASKAAESRLSEICNECGGNFWIDNVDGDIHIELPDTVIPIGVANELRKLWQRCISRELSGLCDVHLILDRSELNTELDALLDKHVVGLSVNGLHVSDGQAATICNRSPRIHTLNLANTEITNECFSTLAQLNLRSLNVENTAVTFDGLKELRMQSHLFQLTMSASQASQSEVKALTELMPGCDIIVQP